MLDVKYIRENIDEVIKRLSTRKGNFDYLKEIPLLDVKRREIIKKVEELKSTRNEKSKLIGQYKRDKKDPKDIFSSIENIGNDIKKYDDELNVTDSKIRDILLETPNLPNINVPIGDNEESNNEIKKVGKIRSFNFPIKDHCQLGEDLGILDFERAAKITGSRFVIYKGLGARLERSLLQFMMDTHSNEKGYTECMPPYIVNYESMVGTGQFPKFKGDSYKIDSDNKWYLNPTAEVPTINMYRDEIIDNLPQKFCSYTTAFRSEAGAAGKDTKGILRQHQFNKVELIKFCAPEESYKELDSMLLDSEDILKKLEIPYRVVELCTGDIGFGMAKTYDIEVWLPGQNTYREIGSISNAEDYQARRANIRFKRTKESKTEYVHTLNGSGLAIGRTVIAIMENYQQKDGSIKVPKALISYMNKEYIK